MSDGASQFTTTSTAIVANVSEFRKVEKYISGGTKNRRRHAHLRGPPKARLEHRRADNNIYDLEQDPIEVSDEECVPAFPPRKGRNTIRTRATPRVLHANEPIVSQDSKNSCRQTNFSRPRRIEVVPTPDTIPTTTSKRKILAHEMAKKRSFMLLQATSSRGVYDSSAGPKICICPSPEPQLEEKLVPFTENGEVADPEYDWLRLDLAGILELKYSLNGCEIVMIHRMGSTSSKLMYKFINVETARKWIRWVEATCNKKKLKFKCTDTSRSQLHRLMDHITQTATQFLGNEQPHRNLEPNDEKNLENQQQGKLQQAGSPKSESGFPIKLPRLSEYKPPTRVSMMKAEGKLSSSKVASDLLDSQSSRNIMPQRSVDADLTGNKVFESCLEPDKWTVSHREYLNEIWGAHPLTYARTQVEKSDVSRLDNNEFLNDNVITFYLRYLQDQAADNNKLLAKRVHFMSTYFYSRLTQDSRRNINHDAVKNWTSKIDLSSYDYILVPVNESYHWYLLIICNLPSIVPNGIAATRSDEVASTDKLPNSESFVNQNILSCAESGDTKDTDSSASISTRVEYMTLGEEPASSTHERQEIDLANPNFDSTSNQPFSKFANKTWPTALSPASFRIISLDSLGSRRAMAIANLKEYLTCEIEHKKGTKVEMPRRCGMQANVPTQLNHFDCGVYLLAFVEHFLQDPDTFITRLAKKERIPDAIDSTKYREKIRSTILKLRKTQRAQEQVPEARKPKQKSCKKTMTPKSSPKSSGSTTISPVSARLSSLHHTRIFSSDIKSLPGDCDPAKNFRATMAADLHSGAIEDKRMVRVLKSKDQAAQTNALALTSDQQVSVEPSISAVQDSSNSNEKGVENMMPSIERDDSPGYPESPCPDEDIVELPVSTDGLVRPIMKKIKSSSEEARKNSLKTVSISDSMVNHPSSSRAGSPVPFQVSNDLEAELQWKTANKSATSSRHQKNQKPDVSKQQRGKSPISPKKQEGTWIPKIAADSSDLRVNIAQGPRKKTDTSYTVNATIQEITKRGSIRLPDTPPANYNYTPKKQNSCSKNSLKEIRTVESPNQEVDVGVRLASDFGTCRDDPMKMTDGLEVVGSRRSNSLPSNKMDASSISISIPSQKVSMKRERAASASEASTSKKHRRCGSSTMPINVD